MKLPKISLTWKIMIGLVVGIFLGWLIGQLDIRSPDHHIFGVETQTILGFVRSLSTLFLNLIKSIIAPLIFATLVVGIAGTGDIKQVGRIGAKSLLYFEVVTTLALVIGLAAVNITRPGDGVSLAGVDRKATTRHAGTKGPDAVKRIERCRKSAAELRVQAAHDPDALTAADEQIRRSRRKRRQRRPMRRQKGLRRQTRRQNRKLLATSSRIFRRRRS